MKGGMKSSLRGLYILGYKRATMKITKRSNSKIKSQEQILKNFLSSN
jgi:hypothetical protein